MIAESLEGSRTRKRSKFYQGGYKTETCRTDELTAKTNMSDEVWKWEWEWPGGDWKVQTDGSWFRVVGMGRLCSSSRPGQMW